MEGTAQYYLNRDFIRFKMAKWGLLFTKDELKRAWKREKSVRRNDPDFMKFPNKTDQERRKAITK